MIFLQEALATCTSYQTGKYNVLKCRLSPTCFVS